MNEPAERRKMTAAEYLAFERSALEKHEFSNGELFAMAGAPRRHNLLVGNVVRELGNVLRERPCEVYPSDMRVKDPASDRYVYPDAVVVCAPPSFVDDVEDTLINPTVLVEVLSPSTEAYDRGEKFDLYRSISSVSDYVLVSTSQEKIEHYTRQEDGSWRYEVHHAGDRVHLASCGCELSVDEVYLKASATAAR